MQWQRMGLKPSAAVLAATAEYLEQQDNLGAWLDECCELTAAFSARRGDLYKSYKEWAEDAGEYALPQKRWIAAMEHKGFMSAMLRGIQMFRGIALRSGGGFPE
jgi:putative DNA primase/helicase